MRLSSFVAPTLVSAVAAADHKPSEAYILRSRLPSPDASASIPHELAEAVLLQRLSTPDRSYPLGSLPDTVSQDDAVAMISQLGKPSMPLFQQAARDQPHQLVIEFSGVTADNYDQIKGAIPRVPLAFTSEHTVSLSATANTKKCAFGPSISLSRGDCWDGNTQYLRYDVTKDTDVVKQLAINLASLKSAAKDGRMETVFLLNGPELSHGRRREEKPMTEAGNTFGAAHPGTTGASRISDEDPVPLESVSFAAPTGIIPSCFKTEEACMKATNNCTGHGQCAQKYSQSEGSISCFHCKCMHTREKGKSGQETMRRWGGSACQKIDISTPFWLFAGVGIALAVTIGFCITLLYNVGEEKLPGVIGAGVSRGSSSK
ncbi:hypothetical protein Micbo1qcDRAFT_231312 [Microdochium bolleyi]|uniref:Vacuolar sorting protein Vps3844 C-terminal domain-containing protein n=1 Tax=Microdochium bolleyi TaxID=196109 RepID=A0A136JGK4_9PEZI|nr:hypothetical protein Micbo1qcDRAFT_231312 [Microdochium bolleyi]